MYKDLISIIIIIKEARDSYIVAKFLYTIEIKLVLIKLYCSKLAVNCIPSSVAQLGPFFGTYGLQPDF